MPRSLPTEFARVAILRRRWRLAEATIVFARVLVLAITAGVVVDALLRFPTAIRWVMLGALAWLAVWIYRKHVAGAIRRRESTVQLALTLEREIPQGAGRIASGTEFADTVSLKASPFAKDVTAEAERIVSSSAIRALVDGRGARREGSQLLLVMGVWTVFAILSPNLAATGLLRICAPWTYAEWPARTSVRSTTFVTHHPRRTSFTLKADLYRGDPTEEPVWVRVRTTRGDDVTDWELLPMMHQGETRFERLIDPTADAVEFLFLTRDMETLTQRVAFVDAPEVLRVEVSITPPSFAISGQPESFDLGRATESRGKVPVPVLEGSLIEVVVTTAPPLPIPNSGSPERTLWEEQTFLWSGMPKGATPSPPSLTASANRRTQLSWKLSWTADVTRTLSLRLTDEHGVRNVDDSSVSIDVVKDAAPEATMLEPSADETVLPTAIISLRAEARDDVGIQEVFLEAARGTEWSRRLASVDGTGRKQVELSAMFDLGEAKASPGDVFEVTCVAADLQPDTVDAKRPPTQSLPRRLRVLNLAEFDEETRKALAALRQGAIRVDERQRAMMERADAAAAQLRPQSEIGERLASLREGVDALERRAQRNRVDDEAMRSLLNAAADILDEAHAKSDDARNDLQEAASSGEDTSAQREAAASAQQSQEALRSELKDLAALLDRDKDSWAATKSLERVAEAIANADKERSKAGAKTIGRPRQELSDTEGAALDKAAELADEAARTAEEVVDELKERGEAVAKNDPARAANLKEAAKRGEQESLSARMEEAEQATRENRLDDARQASAAAMQTVEQMIDDLADDEKSRTETLRRRLSTLAQAIEELVREAESVEGVGLALVGAGDAEAAAGAPGAGKEAASVALNATGIADEGRGAGPESQRVVRLVERGAESEGRAATAFLATPAEVAAGHGALVRSTELFKEALAAAREQERRTEEREKQERARELARAYRALSDRQEGVLTASTAVVGAEPDRRTLVEARRLAIAQEEIRAEIGAIADGSEDVRNSPTFMEATALAMDSAASAVSELKDGSPKESTVELEREVLATLRGLALALDQAAKKGDDPFSDPQESPAGGGGGGGGGQQEPLIAPLAELKVLRALQASIYERTKRVELAGANPTQLEGLAKRQESIARIADQLRQTVERRMQEREAQEAPVIIRPDEPDAPKENEQP